MGWLTGTFVVSGRAAGRWCSGVTFSVCVDSESSLSDFLNSLYVLPMALPISGRRLGPKISKATTAMMNSSGQWNPIVFFLSGRACRAACAVIWEYLFCFYSNLETPLWITVVPWRFYRPALAACGVVHCPGTRSVALGEQPVLHRLDRGFRGRRP